MPGIRQQVTVLTAFTAGVLFFAGSCRNESARAPEGAAQPSVELPADLPISPVLAEERSSADHRGRRENTLSIHLDADPRHLNPMVAPTVWTERIALGSVFETLIRRRSSEAAGPNEFDRGLARSWTVGGREIRLKLEPEARFHDGRRVTAVDVQFSLDAARHPRVDAAHLREHLGAIAAVEIVSATEVRIRLSQSDPAIIRALSRVPILPEHVYQAALRPRRGPVVGSGPYRLASWTDDRVVLERHEEYWGAKPAIARVEYRRERDAARALSAAKSGALDILPRLIPEHYPEQSRLPAVADQFREIRLRPARFRYALFNSARPPFDDVRVREAVVRLLDQDRIASRLYGGLARTASGPVWPGGPIHGDEPERTEYSPERAGALLDDAGWLDVDGDGVREQIGQRRLVVTVLATDEPAPDREAFIDALRKAGFVIDLRVGSSAVLRNRMRRGDFDLGFLEWAGEPDGDLSELLASDGARNYGRHSDNRVDAILRGMNVSRDPARRYELATELGDRLQKTVPWAPLPLPDPVGLIHKRVIGVKPWGGWFAISELSLSAE